MKWKCPTCGDWKQEAMAKRCGLCEWKAKGEIGMSPVSAVCAPPAPLQERNSDLGKETV